MNNYKSDIDNISRLVRESRRLLQEQALLINKAYAEANRSFESIIELRNSVDNSLKPLVEMQRSYQDELGRIQFFEDLCKYKKLISDYKKSLQGLVSPAFTELADSFALLPHKIRTALLALAQHGWFFEDEMYMPGILRLHKALELGDIDEAEIALIDHFRDRCLEIKTVLCMKYPARSNIIGDAFNAHLTGAYSLSVPVFLAQADGLCKEITGHELFRKKDKRPEVAIYIDGVEGDTYLSAMLYPLEHCLPIAASTKDREPDFKGLNRHQVLHGESTTYDTETNSLKAISLLNYVGVTLGESLS